MRCAAQNIALVVMDSGKALKISHQIHHDFCLMEFHGPAYPRAVIVGHSDPRQETFEDIACNLAYMANDVVNNNVDKRNKKFKKLVSKYA